MSSGEKSTREIIAVGSKTGDGSSERWEVTMYSDGRPTGRFTVMGGNSDPLGLHLTVGTAPQGPSPSRSSGSVSSPHRATTLLRTLGWATSLAGIFTRTPRTLRTLSTVITSVAGCIWEKNFIPKRPGSGVKGASNSRPAGTPSSGLTRSGTLSDGRQRRSTVDNTPWSELDFEG